MWFVEGNCRVIFEIIMSIWNCFGASIYLDVIEPPVTTSLFSVSAHRTTNLQIDLTLILYYFQYKS